MTRVGVLRLFVDHSGNKNNKNNNDNDDNNDNYYNNCDGPFARLNQLVFKQDLIGYILTARIQMQTHTYTRTPPPPPPPPPHPPHV